MRADSKVSTKKVNPVKLSKVEHAKQRSQLLRGTIEQVLAESEDAFEHDDVQLLKFHGIYQQEDRDERAARRASGAEKRHAFMARCRLPGGELTAEQYLALDELAERVTYNHSLRLTSRQSIQFHGVIKYRLRRAIRTLHRVAVTTLAACGDVGRNVMAPAAPLAGPGHQAARRLAAEVSDALLPASRAFHEIWIGGQRVTPESEAEPLYGERYLPRKLKVAVALPEDNSVDVYSQDIGLIPILTGGEIGRVNVLVGGGLGMTHRKADTFARLGTPLGSVAHADAVSAVAAITRVFRDHGNRADRKHARLKYLVEAEGIDWLCSAVEAELGQPLLPWVPIADAEPVDLLGAQPQGDGRFFFGIGVPSGRVIDTSDRRLKTALREAVRALGARVVLTPDQNILLCDLEAEAIAKVETILEAYGCAREAVGVRRTAMACPALPTCGLALAESERFLPSLLDDLEAELQKLGMAEEPLILRMTGCPNGCARPYTAEIGVVGRRVGRYDLYVGGRPRGDRLAELYAADVPAEGLVTVLHPLFQRWRDERLGDESLGDFYQRRFGPAEPRHLVTGAKTDAASERLELTTI